MTVEGVIISFIVLCFCMVLSNLLLFPRNARLERYIAREQEALEKEIQALLEAQTKPSAGEDEAAHGRRTGEKMRRPAFLLAYGRAAERVLGECDPQRAQRYLRLAAPVFSALCTAYARKKPIPQTCFVHVPSQRPSCYTPRLRLQLPWHKCPI